MMRSFSKIGNIQVFFLLLAIFTGIFDMFCSTLGISSLWIPIVDIGTILIAGAIISPIIYGMTRVLRPRTRETIHKKFDNLFTPGHQNSHLALKIPAFEAGTAGLFILTTYAYFFAVRTIRTDTYRAMVISILVVFAAFFSYILYLVLSEAFIRIFDRWNQRWPRLQTAVNTYTIALVSIVAIITTAFMSKAFTKAIKTTGYGLPITILLPLILALGITIAGRKSARIKRIYTLTGVWGYYGLSLLFLVVFVLAAPGNSSRAAIADGNVSSLCYQGLRSICDFDGDGQMSLLGDGDCAPWNPRIFTGAPEIPGNGIDENCDGHDMKKTDTLGNSKWNFPVPETWTQKKRSVVLITVDAWNALRCSFNGYKRKTTPFLDKFINQCVYFNSAFSQGPSTRLSFPSIFTSEFDPEIKRARTPRIPFRLMKTNTMLAVIMKKAGFRTIAVLPTSYFSTWQGLTRGFDVVDTGAVAAWHGPSWHNGRVVATRAIMQINKPHRRPVFMWIHIYDTHGPHVQPPKTIKFGKSESDRYDAEVLYVDRQIKRIITSAQEQLGKDTLFIITADHGESFDWRHKRKHHAADIYTTVVHVPLFFCAPGMSHGVRQRLASLLDIFPTLVNLFPAIKTKKKFHFRGTSLVPTLFDPKARTSDRVFQMMFLPEKKVTRQKALWWVGVINQQYDLIWDLRHNAIQAFNWRTDIHDRHNIYSSHKKILQPLVNALSILISRTMPQKKK